MAVRTSQAVVIPGPQSVTLQTVRLQEAGPRDVLVKTRYTSISAGTERLLLAGQLVEMAGLPFPCIPGYETVGEVIEIGPEVPPTYLGQTVFVGGAYGYEGFTSAWGGQSQYLQVEYSKAFPLGPAVNPAYAVAIAPAATAWHGIQLINPQPNDLVVVLGQGPIGQLAAQAAHLKGATVVVADKVSSRLINAVADLKVDLNHETLKDKLPRKADILVDATGKMEAISANLLHCRERGRVLLLGFYQKIELAFAMPFLKELSFQPSREWAAEDIPAVIKALAEGQLQTAHLFTHHFPISDIETAYATTLQNSDCLKVLIEWA